MQRRRAGRIRRRGGNRDSAPPELRVQQLPLPLHPLLKNPRSLPLQLRARVHRVDARQLISPAAKSQRAIEPSNMPGHFCRFVCWIGMADAKAVYLHTRAKWTPRRKSESRPATRCGLFYKELICTEFTISDPDESPRFSRHCIARFRNS